MREVNLRLSPKSNDCVLVLFTTEELASGFGGGAIAVDGYTNHQIGSRAELSLLLELFRHNQCTSVAIAYPGHFKLTSVERLIRELHS